MTAMGNFLTAVLELPDGAVFQGQDNRVPEPTLTDFVVMTTIRRERIETNVDNYADAKFTGTIAGTTMTITHVYPESGLIEVGSIIFGAGVAANTEVTALGTGTGGLGIYTVKPGQTVGSTTLSAGVETITQPTKIVMQLDIHSANVSDAHDMAQTVATLLRDDYGVQQFANQPNGGYGVVPLYAEDPRQMPFFNENQQVETRYVVEAMLQVNQVVTVPQQFADAIGIDVISVDEAYPA